MRAIIKDHIEDFASKEIQYEAWFIGEKLRSHPGEDYAMLFDDRNIEKFVYAKNNYLTKKENDALKYFIDILDEYAEPHKDKNGFLDFDAEKVYNDPKWEKIREEAKKLYELLDKEEGIETLPIVEDWRY